MVVRCIPDQLTLPFRPLQIECCEPNEFLATLVWLQASWSCVLLQHIPQAARYQRVALGATAAAGGACSPAGCSAGHRDGLGARSNRQAINLGR